MYFHHCSTVAGVLKYKTNTIPDNSCGRIIKSMPYTFINTHNMHSSWTYQHLTNGFKHSPYFYHYGKLKGGSTDMPYFKWTHIQITILQSVSRRRELQAEFPELGLLSYLGGEEGPAVGRGAAAACAVAVVRHRPLQAPLGTARCRFSFMIFCRRRQKQRVFIEHASCIHPVPCGSLHNYLDVLIWL